MLSFCSFFGGKEDVRVIRLWLLYVVLLFLEGDSSMGMFIILLILYAIGRICFDNSRF